MRYDSAWGRYVVLKDWAPYLLLTVEMDWEETKREGTRKRYSDHQWLLIDLALNDFVDAEGIVSKSRFAVEEYAVRLPSGGRTRDLFIHSPGNAIISSYGAKDSSGFDNLFCFPVFA
ncbi:hypothetical protein SDJN03_21130, partial [Cucurbita argyrosperma subsp. sororia]